jgi:hypothetical protein
VLGETTVLVVSGVLPGLFGQPAAATLGTGGDNRR